MSQKQAQEQIQKRRKEVSRLFLDNNVSVSDIAKVMNLSKQVISKDINDHVLPELADKYNVNNFLDAQRTKIRSMELQALRLRAKVEEHDGHRYEGLLMRNYELQQQFYQSLIESSPIEDKGEIPISSLRFDEFNKLIGLPQHPARPSERLPLTPAQLTIFDAIHIRRPSWIVVNKARQIGISEIVLRAILSHSISGKYRGGLIPIIAGTNTDTAQSLLDRISELLNPIRQYVKNEVKGEIELVNNTRFIAGSTNANFIRGLTKVRACLIDEAPFFDLVDDLPVLNAIMPIIKTNQSDIFSVGTPNGTNNFHYGLLEAPSTKWQKFEIDIDQGSIGLYTEAEKQDIIANSDCLDVQQEFYCKAVTDRDSFFGSLEPEDFVKMAEGDYDPDN